MKKENRSQKLIGGYGGNQQQGFSSTSTSKSRKAFCRVPTVYQWEES